MHRNKEKPYHVDGAFAAPNIIKSFQVAGNEWLEHSDHVPIILEIDEDSVKTQSNNMILADGNHEQARSYITDGTLDNMDSDIDHMVATSYARLKDITPDIAVKVLLGEEVLEIWCECNILQREKVVSPLQSNLVNENEKLL